MNLRTSILPGYRLFPLMLCGTTSVAWDLENCDLTVSWNQFGEIATRGISMGDLDSCTLTVKYDSLENNVLGMYFGMMIDCNAEIDSNYIHGDISQVRRGMLFDWVRWQSLINPGHIVNARANEIDLLGDGIRIRSSNGLSLEANNIHINPGHQAFPTGFIFMHGIKIEGSQQIIVKDNSIDTEYSYLNNVANTAIFGVFVDNSEEVEVTCNEVSNFGRAMVWKSFCQPAYILIR